MKKQSALVLALCLFALVLAMCLYSAPRLAQEATAYAQAAPVVVIDAGHGGEDGGASSQDGVLESGLNLQFALRMRDLLQFAGVETMMLRETDTALYTDGCSGIAEKKVSDLKNRVALINGTPGALLVSIHQNSLPSHPSTHGAQVFFNAVDPAGEVAQGVQQALNVSLDGGKTVKAMDGGVYLMKQIRCPGVLVECGFLSNDKEAAHLQTEEHQRRLAAAILAGLLQYSTKEG